VQPDGQPALHAGSWEHIDLDGITSAASRVRTRRAPQSIVGVLGKRSPMPPLPSLAMIGCEVDTRLWCEQLHQVLVVLFRSSLSTVSEPMLVVSLLFASSFVQPGHNLPRRVATPAMTSSATTAENSLIDAAIAAGQVGTDAPEDLVLAVAAAAEALSKECAGEPARVPLRGTYELLHSMSKGGSSGKVGPFTGRVTQRIVDDITFVNQVELGPLKVALMAEREVLDADRIRVKFVETAISVFGLELTRKPTQGTGVWQQQYVSAGRDGSARLRVMNTPSLFVLRQIE
jgi:hypothetical protein